jgi:hypothetical protein
VSNPNSQLDARYWFRIDASLPVMLSKINEKTLYVFAISNVITIPMVWALY